jgi:hypothetical protein
MDKYLYWHVMNYYLLGARIEIFDFSIKIPSKHSRIIDREVGKQH